MPRIQPVEPENAPEASRPLMEKGKQGAGKMLNFYKTFAVSPTAFEGYMNLNATLKGGTLDGKMQESIAVAVSDFNGCAYWLAAHAGLAGQQGLDKEEIKRAQGFESEDAQRAAGLRFVREVAETRGHPSGEALEGAREAGFSDEEILEMVANVALTTFSNYTNDLAGTELDIPEVERVHG